MTEQVVAFCRFWRCMPRDVDTLTPAEYDAMWRQAVRETRAAKRAARQAGRRR